MASEHKRSIRYRPEIDGLRAVAVLAVVFFHAKYTGFDGGFVGVDVFFVISGFLITSILRGQLERGTFSIARFYERRIRRLAPALAVVLAATTVLFGLLMTPNDLVEYAESLAAAAVFGSNIYFWRDAGYFGLSAELDPLLHTWSLCIEEQFYLFWPLLLLFARKRAFAVLTLLVIGSLALCTVASFRTPTAAFFLLPTRAWQLGLGGLLVWAPELPDGWPRRLLGWFGLALIAGTVVGLDDTWWSPVLPGFLSSVGAAAVILGGPQWVLTNSPMLFVGKISYSLYLWHWPLLVGLHYYTVRPATVLENLIAIALSFGLAVVSYYLVEERFRHGRGGRGVVFAGGGLAVLVPAAIGGILIATEGLPQRITETPVSQTLDPRTWSGAYQRSRCFLDIDQTAADYDPADCIPQTASGPADVFVYGDSFGAHHMPGLTALSGDATVAQYAAASCRPFPDYGTARCRGVAKRFVDEIIDQIGDYETVVLAGQWDNTYDRVSPEGMEAHLQGTIDRLHARGHRVVLMGQSPVFEFEIGRYAWMQGTLERGGDVHIEAKPYQEVNGHLAAFAKKAGVGFFDPAAHFCEGTRECLAVKDGFPLFNDTGHYSIRGSELLVGELLPLLNERS